MDPDFTSAPVSQILLLSSKSLGHLEQMRTLNSGLWPGDRSYKYKLRLFILWVGEGME